MSNMNSLSHEPQDPVAPEVLERLQRWAEPFSARRKAQLGLFQAIEHELLVELRTHYTDDIDPRFVQDLLDAALQRAASQRPVMYVEEDHAPYRGDGVVFQEVPVERREAVEQMVESMGGRMLDLYRDYLTRHWQAKPEGIADANRYQQRVAKLCRQLCDGLQALLEGPQARQMSTAQLRQAIEAKQLAWYARPALAAMANAREKPVVDAVMRKQLPEWHRNLSSAEIAALVDSQDASSQAHLTVDNLLGDARSLRDHARHLAAQHLADKFDLQLDPDIVSIRSEPLRIHAGVAQTLTLTEQVMEGAIDVRQVYKPLQISMPLQHCKPPTAEQLEALLGSVDAPASYLQVLEQRHSDNEVKLAMLDAEDAGLRYSLLLAAKAGHLSAAHHDQLSEMLSGAAPSSRIHPLQLPGDVPCSDLLLFMLEDGWLVLHAPGKPDGQEWVELVSLQALGHEISGWFLSEVGRRYLLSQVPFDKFAPLSEYMHGIVEKPTNWPVSFDLRRSLSGYRVCLDERVRMRMRRREDDVANGVSPRYLSGLSLQERLVIGLERQVALQAERAFADSLKGYESFRDFAKSTITSAISPYLVEKGISDGVDPESIIFDLQAGQSLNLVDLVCYGYDDNAGLDHPDKRVRSLVGQDLDALRSVDLTYYARRAYIGEKYLAHVRAKFLEETAEVYRERQRLFGHALITAMDRDLRLADCQGDIGRDSYTRLIALVSSLGQTTGLAKNDSTSEAVVAGPGIFRLSIDGCVVLGAYVLRYLEQGRAYDWLYTPDAPDSVLVREYQALSTDGHGALRDYLLSRVGLACREKVAERLQAFAEKRGNRDSLRELNQVLAVAGEYDAFIEHALKDVDDATNSRADVIKAQIFKGVMFASFPLLVYPPFALIFSTFFAISRVRDAVVAHTRGETANALMQWLEASWSVLGAVLSLPGGGLKAGGLGLSATQRLAVAGPAQVGRARPPAMRFDKAWAVKSEPSDLHKVIQEGVWKGTYRSGAQEVPGAEHFILSGGRYYKVMHDAEGATLRVLKANRPGSYHREAVKLHADGRWVVNHTGLRGGNHVLDSGSLREVRQITGRNSHPIPERGALQGEGVVGHNLAGHSNNYLYTVNVQTCVAVSLYNPATRAGAVLHIDHNIRATIEAAFKKALSEIGAADGGPAIRAVMAGGDWLGGTDIGGVVRSLLRRKGVQPSWEHWSYSSCFGNTYGMTLDLGSGITRVYHVPSALVSDVLDPILRQARVGQAGIAGRAYRFKRRFRLEPLYEGKDGVVRNQSGRAASGFELSQHELVLVQV